MSVTDMGGCQNYDPFLGTLNIWCRIIIGTQKGSIIFTTAHITPYKRALTAVRVDPQSSRNRKMLPAQDSEALHHLDIQHWGPVASWV